MKKPFSYLALLFLLLGSFVAEPIAASSGWLVDGAEEYRLDSNAGAPGNDGTGTHPAWTEPEAVRVSEYRTASDFVTKEASHAISVRHFERTWRKTGPPGSSS